MTKLINKFGRVLCALLLCAGFVLSACTEEVANVPVTGVTLDTEVLELVEGETGLLNATISPVNATHKNLLWVSSNSSIVTVSDGIVNALKPGNAKVTVKTDDGGKIATCNVVVKSKSSEDGNDNEGGNGGDDNGDGGADDAGDENKFGPATVSVAEVTATTATLKVHVDLSQLDLSFAQVSLYYSDSEPFNLNNAMVLSKAEFDSNNDFVLTLTDLKYNTKYNYAVLLKVKQEETYSNILSFTTENISISLSAKESTIVSMAPVAEFVGVVKGLSEEDKPDVEVGVAYYTTSEGLKTNSSTKVAATSVISDGSFELSKQLSIDTKYYYCSYVKQNSKYVYGTEINELQTIHPYSVLSDLNVASATDLSSSASANCYIVSNAGLYKFKTVKGNSSKSVGNVASASILWETFGTSETPELLALVKAFCYKDGYIAFQTADSFKEGNAVIAAKDANGNILWSWHIWFTDQPKGQVYYNNAGTMMDRNLGATSATPGAVGALGLLYQWGRKDPFLGSSSILPSIEAASTIAWPSAVSSDSSTGTIAYATANPTTFIGFNSNNHDWYYTGSESTDNTRWTTSESSKSIYDPCPAGWRVPDGGSNGIWSKALGSTSEFIDHSLYGSTNKGMNFSRKFGADQTIWYPASGCRGSSGGRLCNVGYYGFYWSASPSNDRPGRLCFGDDGSVSPSDGGYRASGQSVRCLQE